VQKNEEALHGDCANGEDSDRDDPDYDPGEDMVNLIPEKRRTAWSEEEEKVLVQLFEPHSQLSLSLIREVNICHLNYIKAD